MGKFVLVYKGGAMAPTEAEQAKVMEAWMGWFGEISSSVVDMGNPFGASAAVGSDGSSAEVTTGLGGYSILSADSIAAASTLAKGCPVLTGGGSVEIYEALEM